MRNARKTPNRHFIMLITIIGSIVILLLLISLLTSTAVLQYRYFVMPEQSMNTESYQQLYNSFDDGESEIYKYLCNIYSVDTLTGYLASSREVVEIKSFYILKALLSAEYEKCTVRENDYDVITIEISIMGKNCLFMLSYCYADGELYLFTDNNTYRITQYDVLVEYVKEVIDTYPFFFVDYSYDFFNVKPYFSNDNYPKHYSVIKTFRNTEPILICSSESAVYQAVREIAGDSFSEENVVWLDSKTMPAYMESSSVLISEASDIQRKIFWIWPSSIRYDKYTGGWKVGFECKTLPYENYESSMFTNISYTVIMDANGITQGVGVQGIKKD